MSAGSDDFSEEAEDLQNSQSCLYSILLFRLLTVSFNIPMYSFPNGFEIKLFYPQSDSYSSRQTLR